MSEMVTVALCPERASVGCVLIQAIFGATIPRDLLARFDWDVSIEGMRLYSVDPQQLLGDEPLWRSVGS